MEATTWITHFALALVLGALIGLEREVNERKGQGNKKGAKTAVVGLRTFSLSAGIGSICGVLYAQYLVLAALLGATFSALLLSFYVIDSRQTNDSGTTTEIALLYSFSIGFIVAVGLLPEHFVIALTVVLLLLMSRKEKIKDVVEDISRHEINAFVSFAILAFVILPFLPNQTFALSHFPEVRNFFQNVELSIERFWDLELFNPFKLWFIVVLITGVDLLGYILEKVLGKKSGWLLASLIGGFVSSTATTISIAVESKKAKHDAPLLAAAILATMVSFIPIAFLLATLNVSLFISFFPILSVIFIACLVLGIYFLRTSTPATARRKSQRAGENKIAESHHIFNLSSALKFMGIYLFISISSKIALELFGQAGFLATTTLGATTGIDAVVINTAQLVGNGIDFQLGIWGLVLANAVNLGAKSMYCYLQGSKSFALKYAVSMAIVVGCSVLVPLVW